MTLHDDVLSAFMDGRLSPESEGEIRQRISCDRMLASRVERFRRADAAARDWFGASLEEPPAAMADAVRRGFTARKPAGRSLPHAWLAPLAVAAGIAAVAVIGLNHEVDRRVSQSVAQMRLEREADLQMLASAMQEALETRVSGTEVIYRNDSTGTSVKLTPLRTWRNQQGQWCREFAEVFSEPAAGPAPLSIACRQSDGSWQRVKTELRGSTAASWPKLPPGANL